MKKNNCLLIIITACSPFFVSAQTKRTLSAAEIKEWESSAGVKNVLDNIPAAKKAKAREYAQTLMAYSIKSLLHEANPAKYPLEAAANSPQATVTALLKKASPATFQKMKARAISFMSANDSTKTAALGKLKAVDFTQKAIEQDVQRLIVAGNHPLAIRKQDHLAVQKTDNMGKMERSDKLKLVLRNIFCVDQTNPEGATDDDILLGGILIGCSGNVRSVSTQLSCHFHDGETCNHGDALFGTFDLGNCDNYPKKVYGIFQLAEVDEDMNDCAEYMNDLMEWVAETVDAEENIDNETKTLYIAYYIETMGGIFFYDALFKPYVVDITLANASSLGSDGKSDDLTTGNIADFGGRYRIGFRWQR